MTQRCFICSQIKQSSLHIAPGLVEVVEWVDGRMNGWMNGWVTEWMNE